MLDTESVCDEIRGQRIQEVRVGGRAGHAKIGDRLNDATTKISAPNTVRDSTGKERILRRSDPARQRLPYILARLLGVGGAVQIFGLDRLFGLGMNDLAAVLKVDVALRAGVHELGIQPGEECGESVEIILRVFFPWLIVATGAFQPNTEKGLADVGRDIARIELARDKVETRCRIVVQVSLADHQFRNHAIVGFVFYNGLADPVVEELGALVAALIES